MNTKIMNLFGDDEQEKDLFRKVDTGGRRNENPLTQQQKEETIEYAISLGISKDHVFYTDHGYTSYGDSFDVLRIGTDVYPTDVLPSSPNSRISWKGAIAHELIGHREAYLRGWTQSDAVLEEVQASLRAAKFAPKLTETEKQDLVADALNRLAVYNKTLDEVESSLFIEER